MNKITVTHLNSVWRVQLDQGGLTLPSDFSSNQNKKNSLEYLKIPNHIKTTSLSQKVIL